MTILLAILLSVTSPLQSAGDYHFTSVTNMESFVKGVIGGRTGTGGTIRMEDRLFINEAVQERNLYVSQPTTQAWIRAAAKANSQVVGAGFTNNVSEKYKLALPSVSSFNAAFVNPDSAMADGARLIYRNDPDGTSVTNIYNAYVTTNLVFTSDIDFETQRYRFADGVARLWAVTNTIEQTMTNGLTDVFTNVYPKSGSLLSTNKWFEVETTNTLQEIDFAFAERRLGFYETLPSNRWTNPLVSKTVVNWHRRQDLVDAYELLAKHNMAYGNGANASVSANGLYRRYYDSSSNHPINHSTNYVTSVSWGIREQEEYSSVDEYLYSNYKYGEWEKDSGTSSSTESSIKTCTEDDLKIRFNMPSAVDTMWYAGQGGRFDRAWGFAVIHIEKTVGWSRNWTQSGGGGLDGTNLTYEADVMVPLGELYVDKETDYILLTASKSSEAAIDEALVEAEIEPPVYCNPPQCPELHAGETIELKDTRGDPYYRYKGSSAYAKEILNVNLKRIYVIYTFKTATTVDE